MLAAALVFGLGAFAGPVQADVVVVVSARSTLVALSREQTADLFLGKAVRLPDGEPAAPVDLPEGSPLRDEFYQAYAGRTPAQVKALWSRIIFTGRGRPPPELPDSAAVKPFVAANPQAIGYIDRAALDASVKMLRMQP